MSASSLDEFFEERTGFAWHVMARYQRADGSRLGVLLLEDADVADPSDPLRTPLTARNGSVKVLVKLPGTQHWRCETVTTFAPGKNKLHLLVRTGPETWQPYPMVVEKLALAYSRGVDVLALPLQRVTADVGLKEATFRGKTTRETVTGAVSGEPVWHGSRTASAQLARFLADLPLSSSSSVRRLRMV
mgnify:CR=1 FL=1